MPPKEWIKQVLNRHSLQKPDERPLYQYRITDAEFNELKELIKINTAINFDITNRRLNAVIVFYAAEWWQRQYSGQWRWQDIFNSIDLDMNNFSTNDRNQLVKSGLLCWYREVRKFEGRSCFLGTIATEGGLPLKQFADSGGWLQKILNPVVEKHINKRLPIDALINAYSENIPSSYQSVEIKKILEEIVDIISKLHRDHKLEEKERPVQWLDKNYSNWREQFPLPINDKSAIALLGELVDVAANTNISSKISEDSLFSIDRFIKVSTISPKLVARFELPAHIPLELINKEEGLPSRVNIEIVADTGETWQWCYGIKTIYKGNDVYKLIGKAFEVSNNQAMNSFSIRVKDLGQILYKFPILSAERIAVDCPWLLKNTNNRYEYYGSASQTIRDQEAIIYLPKSFSFNKATENTVFNKKQSFLNGGLFILSGSILCQRGTETYKFQTNSTEDTLFNFEISGKCYLGFSTPTQVYLKKPEIYQRHKITNIRTSLNSSSGQLMFVDKGILKPFNEIQDGVHELRLIDNKTIKWRSRIAILNNFSINFKPDYDSPLKGEIHLTICSEHIVTANADGTKVNVSQEHLTTIIKLQATSTVPSFITINILPQHSKREISLTAPFPSSGALLYSPDKNLVKNGKHLYFKELHGYRLIIFNHFSINYAYLRFKLVDNQASIKDSRDLYIEKKIKLSTQLTEFSLIDWQQIIQSLLSVGTELDSYVQLTLSMGNIENKICFNLYQSYLELKQSDKYNIWLTMAHNELNNFDIESIQNTELRALRLNQPEQDDIILTALTSEGTHNGLWNFKPKEKHKNRWLIYPAECSVIKFKPLFWFNKELLEKSSVVATENINSLAQASQIIDNSQRSQAIKQVLNQMANDLDHESWQYLKDLTQKTKHLPLTTFEIWKISIGESKFLAALFIQNGFENIVSRLTEELPIVWELVRINDWVSVLNSYKTKLTLLVSSKNDLYNQDDTDFIDKIIYEKIKEIYKLSPSLDCLAKILRSIVLNETDKELKIMSIPAEISLKPITKEAFQNLLRRQAESEWPQMLNKQLKDIQQQLPETLKELLEVKHHFQVSVVLLPIILAWRSYTTDNYGWLGNAANIFKIEQLKSFDDDWFDTVFNFTTGWLFHNIDHSTK